MYIFQVHHYIKSEGIEAYKAVTLENAQKTRLEPGVLRFEFFQDAANPAHFSLFEVYADMAARDAHLQTEHFLKWKCVDSGACRREKRAKPLTWRPFGKVPLL